MNKKTDVLLKSKIVLADDHPIFREGIKLLIEFGGLGEVIGEAENGAEFLKILSEQKPDMAIIDIDMPVMDGLQATRKALSLFPDLKILILSMHGSQSYYSSFIEAGVKGFVMKTADKAELELAIAKISQGESYFSQELLLKIISDLKNPSKKETPKVTFDFTDREVNTLTLLCQGLSINEIAEKMFLSPKTIEAYRSNLLHKTETKNTLSLVLFAIKNQLVTEY